MFEDEPLSVDSPLLALPNVILRPHSAAMTHEGARQMGEMTAQNVLDHFDGTLTPDRIFNSAVLDGATV